MPRFVKIALVVTALACGLIAVLTKGAFGVNPVQFAGSGVVFLAVAVLL